jgi:hypothetical protein
MIIVFILFIMAEHLLVEEMSVNCIITATPFHEDGGFVLIQRNETETQVFAK